MCFPQVHDNGSLTFSSVEKQDEADYRCKVRDKQSTGHNILFTISGEEYVRDGPVRPCKTQGGGWGQHKGEYIQMYKRNNNYRQHFIGNLTELYLNYEEQSFKVTYLLRRRRGLPDNSCKLTYREEVNVG